MSIRGDLSSILVFTIAAAGLPAQNVAFSDDFNFGNALGWQVQGEWQIGAAQSSGGQNFGFGDPSNDADGTFQGGVAGIVLGGNATTDLHAPHYLVSPAIDTAGASGITLRFRRWLNCDWPPYMHHTIEVFDGTSWTTIFDPGHPGVADSGWTLQSYDLGAFASPAMRIRFGTSVTAPGSYDVSSWNLDNVRVEVCQVPSALQHGGFDNFPLLAPWLTVGAGPLPFQPAWTVVSGNVDLVGSQSWPAVNGGNSLDLNGTTAGAIAQTVLLETMSEYALDFALSRNPGAASSVTLSVHLAFASGSNLPALNAAVTFTNGASSAANMMWEEVRLLFQTIGANPTCGTGVPATITFTSTSPPTPWGPVIDDVRLTRINGGGQPNSAGASLKVNGLGPAGAPGPWLEALPAGSNVVFQVQGAPQVPFVLAASPVRSFHNPVPCLGSLDIGTPPAYADIVFLFNGLASPGSLIFVTDAAGFWTASIPLGGVPPGSELNLQAAVATPASGCGFTLTAAHTLWIY